MTVRVWSAEGSTYIDYPEAAIYQVGTSFELDLRDAGSKLLVSYPPGNWHHVEVI